MSRPLTVFLSPRAEQHFMIETVVVRPHRPEPHGADKSAERKWHDELGRRALLAVARCGTLRKAASQLHVDQATVGRRLSAFEDALGSKLFIRTPKSFALSPLGRKCWRT